MISTTQTADAIISPPDAEDLPRLENRLPKEELDARPVNRLAAVVPPTVIGSGLPHKQRPTLAAFCFEDPAGPIGQHLARSATALARRQIAVHVFSRRAFPAALS